MVVAGAATSGYNEQTPNPRTRRQGNVNRGDLIREIQKLERLARLDPVATDYAGTKCAFEILYGDATEIEFDLGVLRRSDDPDRFTVELDRNDPNAGRDDLILHGQALVASAAVEHLRRMGELRFASLDEALAS
jgi:hypothetical protein